MSEQAVTPGSTAEQPVYFKWVTDRDGRIRWGRVLLMLGVTVASAYLSVRTQRAGSSADFEKTLRMAVARRRITVGVRLQQAGRAVEDAGWAAYDSARG